MSYQTGYAKELLAKVPRLHLGFYPTQLQYLERLSRETGVNIYLKREDLSGCNLFGGNKMRKLEFLLAKAKEEGCDYVFTFGATQSNHAMQTAAACCKCGLKPVLFLVSLVETDESAPKANLLLDKIFGAEVRIIPAKPGEQVFSTMEKSAGAAEAYRKELEAAGHKCFVIPTGGASPLGAVGFYSGYLELCDQLNQLGHQAAYLFHSTGSGGTLAGLAAGQAMVEPGIKIISIAVDQTPDDYREKVAAQANEMLAMLGAEKRVEPDALTVSPDYYAPGYECPNEKSSAAIKRLARTEGVLLDPVYSGKGFAGMLDYIEKGLVKQGETVVFLHTGGATALFAEPEIVGDLTGPLP